jgi:3-methyladenine DNA glycosylase AlkD
MDMAELYATTVKAKIESVLAQLRVAATTDRAEHEKAYHKSDLEFVGANAATIRRVAKSLAKERKDTSRAEVIAFAEELWKTKVHELRSVALLLLIELSDKLRTSDLPRLKRYVKEGAGWALVDTIGCWLLPRMIENDRSSLKTMDKWAVDQDFWVRRAAMLSLLATLRKGDLTHWQRFVRYSEPQLEEKEFFIRKCIGWILRETSKKQPQVVFDYLRLNLHRTSGLTLREGAKYLPPAMRKKLGL